MEMPAVSKFVRLTFRSSLFCDVTRRSLVVTDFSGQSIGLIFKSQSVEDDCFTPQCGKTACSETSVNYPSTLRNITEERRSNFHCGGSMRTCQQSSRFVDLKTVLCTLSRFFYNPSIITRVRSLVPIVH
jgi:hypothetical protein